MRTVATRLLERRAAQPRIALRIAGFCRFSFGFLNPRPLPATRPCFQDWLLFSKRLPFPGILAFHGVIETPASRVSGSSKSCSDWGLFRCYICCIRCRRLLAFLGVNSVTSSERPGSRPDTRRKPQTSPSPPSSPESRPPVIRRSSGSRPGMPRSTGSPACWL